MSATIAQFSATSVRSARSMCRRSDFATSVTTGAWLSSNARTCGSSAAAVPALRVAPNATERGVLQLQLPRRGAGEELGVLGQRAGPATLDEAHAQRVEVAGDGELVGHRVRDALALGAVAQRRVEDVEGVAEGGRGGLGAGHRNSFGGRVGNKKTPRGCERSARRPWCG